MAKSKTKKKTSLMLIISAILLIAVSVMSLCMMSLPMSKTVTINDILDTTTVKESISAFDHIKEWTEKDEDGDSKLSTYKEWIKDYEEGSIKVNILGDSIETAKHKVAIVECLIVVIAAAAVAMVLGLVALVLAFVKKNGAGKVFGLLALLCVLAIFILSCIVYAFYNPVATALDGTIAGVTTTTTVVSAMALLIVSLIGFVASTVTLVLSRK